MWINLESSCLQLHCLKSCCPTWSQRDTRSTIWIEANQYTFEHGNISSSGMMIMKSPWAYLIPINKVPIWTIHFVYLTELVSLHWIAWFFFGLRRTEVKWNNSLHTDCQWISSSRLKIFFPLFFVHCVWDNK